MSDNWLYLVPTDPWLIPEPHQQRRAEALLNELPLEREELTLNNSGTMKFYDCGSNLEMVFCPFCETDILDWWCAQPGPQLPATPDELKLITPCCNRETTHNDLDFVSPQAFASFAIEITNPDRDLEPDEFQSLEAAIGMPLRAIWCHI